MATLPSNSRTVIGLMAVVVIGLSVASLIFRRSSPVERERREMADDFGAVLAKETTHRLGRGSTVVIVRADPKCSYSEVIDRQVRAFTREVRSAQMKVETDSTSTPWPNSDEWVSLWNKHAQAGALLAFVAVPNLTAEDKAKLSTPRAKLILIGETTIRLHQFCTDDMLLMAVNACRGPGAATSTAQRPRERFDQVYEIVGCDALATP